MADYVQQNVNCFFALELYKQKTHSRSCAFCLYEVYLSISQKRIRIAATSARVALEILTRFGVLVCGHTGAGAPTCGTTILKKAYIEAGGINYDFGPSADAVLCYQIMKNYDVITTDCVIGGYRWNQNASLNKQTLLDFIQADDLLMQYAYQKDSKTALWGRWFGAAISWRNIWRKNNIAAQYGIPINQEEFAQASCFSRPSVVNQKLYLALYAGYRLLRKIIGSVMLN